MIKAEHVSFEYFRRDENGNVSDMVEAVKDLSLEVKQGEFIGILGCNGSGKSTFAKMLNALLDPTEGEIWIEGMSTKDSANTWNIRENTGMVFQNPDNQIIGTIVEEDVAFGPENLGAPTDEIWSRVSAALETVGMTAYREQSPNRLSGGQKQRVAIAGVLAMQPKCIIFDESTAMLDPKGRQEVLKAAHMLNREKGITILFITHNMEEVVEADRIVVMNLGKLVAEGTPQEIFSHPEQMQEYGLELPRITELAVRLKKNGIPINGTILDEDMLVSELERVAERMAGGRVGRTSYMGQSAQTERTYRKAGSHTGQSAQTEHVAYMGQEAQAEQAGNAEREDRTEVMRSGLILDHISYRYNPGTIYEYPALQDVSLSFAKGEFVAIIGHTGSGKSTLIQQFNGLLEPDSGHIYFEGKDVFEKGYNRTHLREKVGLVFQYPEYQLFAETVLEDVSFGPKNLKLPLLEVQQRAFQAIEAVGLSDAVYDSSPFELSGGQKRRVAIAGVLAMQPDILVLDEPVAGLDPVGRKELLQMLRQLNQKGMTIVLVSHNMEDVAEYADRVIVMNQGTVDFDGKTAEVFQREQYLQELGLDIPVITHVMKRLREEGDQVNAGEYRMQRAVEELTAYLSGQV